MAPTTVTKQTLSSLSVSYSSTQQVFQLEQIFLCLCVCLCWPWVYGRFVSVYAGLGCTVVLSLSMLALGVWSFCPSLSPFFIIERIIHCTTQVQCIMQEKTTRASLVKVRGHSSSTTNQYAQREFVIKN